MFQLKQHTKSLVDMEWIPALSPTWRNVQTTTKSFVDKRKPLQNRVPDRHVGDKLSFQVNWTLWINRIALSSSGHSSSTQNHWWIRSGFPLSPQLEETSKPWWNHWLIKEASAEWSTWSTCGQQIEFSSQLNALNWQPSSVLFWPSF